jgi:hypothetical protein
MNTEASRRVLDMLAGWTAYLDTSVSEAGDPHRTDAEQAALYAELETVANLYQEFAANELLYEDEAYINVFITDKILPFILKGR